MELIKIESQFEKKLIKCKLNVNLLFARIYAVAKLFQALKFYNKENRM